MLSRSVVSDSAIFWMTACQVPLTMGFSRQWYWSGLLFPTKSRLLKASTKVRTAFGSSMKTSHEKCKFTPFSFSQHLIETCPGSRPCSVGSSSPCGEWGVHPSSPDWVSPAISLSTRDGIITVPSQLPHCCLNFSPVISVCYLEVRGRWWEGHFSRWWLMKQNIAGQLHEDLSCRLQKPQTWTWHWKGGSSWEAAGVCDPWGRGWVDVLQGRKGAVSPVSGVLSSQSRVLLVPWGSSHRLGI